MRSARGLFVVLVACHSASTQSPTTNQGSWSDAIALSQPRFEGYAASDGARVLMIGGIIGENGDFSTAEPTARVDMLAQGASAWTPGPALPAESAKHHLAVAVVEDRVFVLGGFDGIIGRQIPGEAFVPRATTFVLRNGAWSRLRDQPLARGAATAQALGRKIHVVGGAPNEGVAPYAQHFVYDVDADTWEERRALPTAREHLASCVLDGKMLVVGGWVGPDDIASTAAELYDPVSDTWEKVPPLPSRRGGLGAVTFNGACHVIGGEDWKVGLPGTTPVHEVFDLAQRTWTTAAALPEARHGIGVVITGEQIMVVGGGPVRGNSYTSRVDVFTKAP